LSALASRTSTIDRDELLKEFKAMAVRFENAGTAKPLKAIQQIARLERLARRHAMDARKQHTRHKIQLGGLIVKAGLGQEPAAVIRRAARRR
jgi:hypothetical protein